MNSVFDLLRLSVRSLFLILTKRQRSDTTKPLGTYS